MFFINYYGNPGTILLANLRGVKNLRPKILNHRYDSVQCKRKLVSQPFYQKQTSKIVFSVETDN